MSWKYRILIAFLCGVAFILYFVVRSMNISYEMAEDDYYNKELQYSSRQKAISNFDAIQKGIQFHQNTHEVSFAIDSTLASKIDSGDVNFYYAAGKKSDRKFSIEKSAGNYHFPKTGMAKGKYIVKINFHSEGKPYYHEEVVFIE